MWPVDATPAHLDRLDQTIKRLVDLLTLRAQIDAAVAVELAVCGEVATAIGALDSHPKNQESVDRLVAAEVGAKTRINDRAMESMIGDAYDFSTDFPHTLAALGEAQISSAHVRVIRQSGVIIRDPELRARYEAAVLEYAVKETSNRLRPIAKRLAEQLTEETLEERHEGAKSTRDVQVFPIDNGMAQLVATLPATEAFAIKDRVSQMAHAAESSGRSIPELRADILTDLLLTAHPNTGIHNHAGMQARPCTCTSPRTCNSSQNGTQTAAQTGTRAGCGGSAGCGGLGNIQARVMVTIPVLALLPNKQAKKIRQLPSLKNIAGLDGAAQLAGYGPIDSATAKALAGSAKGWDRIMVHPITGAVLAVDRYRPSQELRRTLTARDMHCRFPGCRIPVNKCDLDHTIDAALGGQTEANNLAYLCRRHHSLKHHTPWQVEQLENGKLKWTSPIGYVYLEPPPSNAMFKPLPPSKPATARAKALSLKKSLFNFDGPPPF